MARKRYKEQGTELFFGEYLYDRTVLDSHFLRQLEALVDWDVFAGRLVHLYRGQAEVGRPPYNPAVILKMLLLSYLHDLSERPEASACGRADSLFSRIGQISW